jgi:REP element-mobilizing transposase RayT
VREPGGIFFITSTIVEWVPVFTCKEHFEIIISSLSFCRKEKKLKLFAYVILENHLHAIVSSPNLPQTVQSFKSFTAKELLKSLRGKHMDYLLNQFAYFKAKYKETSDYQVWQEGYHPQQMFSEDVLFQKIEYIHYNPVRRGYVEKPEYWRFSSAKDFLTGEKGPIELDSLNG